MVYSNKPNSLAMGGVTSRFGKLILLAAVPLLIASCAQRFGPAPVVNGISGDKVNPVRGEPFTTGRSVIVRKGDSLFKIARKYRVSLRGLINVNHMKSPYIVYPGQKVLLPLTPTPARKPKGQGGGKNRIESTKKFGTDYSLESGSKTFKTSRIPPLKRRKISRREFIWPVNGRVLSRFGAVGKGLQNDGINILARKGTPVRAIQDGVVAYVGNELRGFGNLLLVKHFGGWISAYAHNDEILVNTGQSVRRGQVISRVGKTGSVDKPQLHFELRRGKKPVDPEKYLDRETLLLKG